MKVSRLVLLVAAWLCFLFSSTAARTWHVKAHGRGDAPTIQAAIDSASNGDTVILANGTYTGDGNRDIDLHGKAITVRSQSDNPRACIIDCQTSESELHYGFSFYSDYESGFTLRGVTVKNGHYGVSLRDGRSTFTNCCFSGNSLVGLEVFSCSAVIDHCTFSGNLDLGVCVENAGRLKASGCVFSGNVGAGLAAFCRPLLLELFECEFSGNGTGATLVESFAHFKNCTFSANEGAGLSWSQAGGKVEYCSFSKNAGGGISTTESATITHCTFSENSSLRGGAIYMVADSWYGSLKMNINDCTFIKNSASEGGAVYCGAGYNYFALSVVQFQRCTFAENSAGRGGALHCSRDRVESDSLLITLEGCTVYGNTADEGGGVFYEGGQVSIDLKNTIISGSRNGEALFCNEVTPTPTLACCDIYGNAGGDWVACIEDQYGVNGNFSLDPLFRNPDKEDFRLSSLSPCLAENNTCGVLIGAYGEGCNKSKPTPANAPSIAGEVVLSISPNPFNPATRMSYTLSTRGVVRLSVYDVAGRLVEKLVDAMQPAGEHVLEWKAGNLPSGIYFCRLETVGAVETRKLVLLK